MPKKYSNIIKNVSQAMSIKYNSIVYELQRQKKDVTVLSLGEAFFDIPMYSFSDINFEKGYHYSDSRGILELRKIISEYYTKEYDINSDAKTEILVSAGSKLIIYMALLCIVNPDDEVIYFEPAWVSYPEQIKLCHGNPVSMPYYEGIDDLEKYITPKTKAVIINTPNNPSGKIYSKQELSRLYEIAKKYDLYIISDEAYSDFTLNEEPFVSAGIMDEKFEKILIINSLSKNLGMSGWRIGYVISNSEMIDKILIANQHIMTCPTTLIENYLIEHFETIIQTTKPQINEVVLKRKEISDYMEEIGIKRLAGSGTFYFCISIEESKLGSEDFADKLLKEKYIATVPGIGYGASLDKFLRIGVGTESVEKIKSALITIKNMIDETA